MPWQELTFNLQADQVSSYEDALLECGALSVTLRDAGDEPLLEPAPETTPLWEHALLTAMFDMQVDIQDVLSSLKQQLNVEALPAYTLETLEDQEWRLTWRDYFEPMRFGEHLWICPSGYDLPDQQDAVIIRLDPGLAFGTGSHPTTALCLEWLDRNDIQSRQVIDYGCGSGILALAAAKLQAQHILAVDNDPQALQATQDNSALNDVGSLVSTCLPQDMPAIEADIIIANILFEPLMSLRETFLGHLKPGGHLVMSGVLAEQQEALVKHYQDNFDIEACEQQEEWVRLHAIRR